MAFEIYVPRSHKTVDPGHCSIDCSGHLRISVADLAAVRINGEAGILIDAGTRRLAVRAPRDGLNEPIVPVRMTKARRTGMINAAGALAAIGRQGTKGRFDLQRKDDLLIVDFASADPKKGKKS